jgi:hypothetical protein
MGIVPNAAHEAGSVTQAGKANGHPVRIPVPRCADTCWLRHAFGANRRGRIEGRDAQYVDAEMG